MQKLSLYSTLYTALASDIFVSRVSEIYEDDIWVWQLKFQCFFTVINGRNRISWNVVSMSNILWGKDCIIIAFWYVLYAFMVHFVMGIMLYTLQTSKICSWILKVLCNWYWLGFVTCAFDFALVDEFHSF